MGEVPRGEKMLYSGTDPEPDITEYTLLYEENTEEQEEEEREGEGASPPGRILKYTR